jgi:hypothetical protein
MTTLRFAALVGATLALLALAAGCQKGPSVEECGTMLDRYVDMTAGQDPAFAGLAEERAALLRASKRAQKRLEASYTRALTQCQREVSRAEYECAMKAKTPNDWEACIE